MGWLLDVVGEEKDGPVPSMLRFNCSLAVAEVLKSHTSSSTDRNTENRDSHLLGKPDTPPLGRSVSFGDISNDATKEMTEPYPYEIVEHKK
jgi:hypothetical protein